MRITPWGWAAIIAGAGFLLSRTATAADKMLTKEQRTAAIIEKAERYGIPPAVALAVFEIESGGAGFAKDGRMIIRYEPHIFAEYSDKTSSANRAGQAAEWDNFDRASAIDPTAAMLAISMGGPQIMGFNFKTIGFDTVRDMFQAFSTSEEAQIDGFFAFCEKNGLIKAAQQGDWTAFARGYNGKGQVGYDTKMKQRHAAYVAKGYQGVA